MEKVQAADPVGKIQRDPVEHDTADDLMNAQLCLEQTYESGIEGRDQHCGDNNHQNRHRFGEIEHTAHHCGYDAAHDILSLCTDIEKPGLDCESNTQTCEDNGRRPDDHTGDILGSADHALHQCPDRFHGRITRRKQDQAGDTKSKHDCDDSQDKRITEKSLS